jgi:hypothetical protein
MVRAMRSLALVLALVACGHDAPTPTTLESRKPVTRGMVISDVSATAGKLDAVGPLAPQPPAPTLEAVTTRVCGIQTPVELGAAGRHDAAVAFGPTSGIVTWSPNDHQLAIRAIDRTGKPLGEAHVIEAPARSSSYAIRAIDGHYIVFVSDTDLSGPSPVLDLYALLTDTDGVPSAHFTKVAIGERGMIDDISPGGTRGVLVWAGPTEATHIDKGRLVSLTVDGKGGLAQSYIDFPDPAPGTRAFAFFSLGEHAVTVIGGDVIVDGEVKARQDDKAYTPQGLVLAPTFTGSSVPVLGMQIGREAKWLRYGTLGLDGTFHFDTTDVPKTAALKAPFEDRVSWGASDTGVDGRTEISRVEVEPVTLQVALRGKTPEVVWTGDRVLLVSTADGKVRTAPLPCL